MSDHARRDVSFLRRYDFELLCAVIVGAMLVARHAVVSFESGDYRGFLLPWWTFIRTHGHFGALQHAFSNYTPPYLYVLTVLTWSGLGPLGAIKAFGAVCDIAMAYFVARIVARHYRGREVPTLAFLVVLAAPTVFINSAVWGQNDSMYTLFLVAAVWASLEGLPAAAILGVGFAIKLQSVFLIPWLAVLVIRGVIRARTLLMIPAAYLLAIMPAWLLGRPLGQLLLLYKDQADYYKALSLNFPNLYTWFPSGPGLRTAGLCLAVVAAAVLCFVAGRSEVQLTDESVVLIALLCAVMFPFVLPGMHDRYLFPADVLAIVYAFIRPDRWWIAVAVTLVSLASYTPFLFGFEVVSLRLVALVLLAILVWLARETLAVLQPRLVVDDLSRSGR